ncbi:MAG TPA: hypothetical protein VNM15_05680 [Candidatus Binatia bacterium]|nr:hypothetical protein [Candidatus Binatia bacterium]
MIAASAFAASVGIGLTLGIPAPGVHDEFSYLLAADTFAHGRLTNPTHPLWMHFETMHVIQQPSYMSKYPPAQGLFLALGKLLGGHPIIGVWLSMACMGAAICWMLYAWVPPRWAIWGGVFAIVHPHLGVAGYWAQSYWGGAVAATGGALLLGGARYLCRKPSVPCAIATGLGLALLANARPYEGLLVALPVGIGLAVWLAGRHGPGLRVAVRKIILPLIAVGAMTLAAMAYYNDRVTGSALRLPYGIHERTYSVTPVFIWQRPLSPAPHYRHEMIREFQLEYALGYYRAKRSWEGFITSNLATLVVFALLGLNVFVIPLMVSFRGLVGWIRKNRWGRWACSIYIVFLAGIMLETYNLLHYWAPVTALSYLFVVQSIRLWRARDRRVGRWVPIGLLCMAATLLTVGFYRSTLARDQRTWAQQRAELLTRLSQDGERHLVLVQYGPEHSFHREWVYNEADIDGSKVVWARDMGSQENCRLIDYFKDRRVWFLAIDRDDAPIKLEPFPEDRCRS